MSGQQEKIIDELEGPIETQINRQSSDAVGDIEFNRIADDDEFDD